MADLKCDITVTPCNTVNGLVECPRCWHWHSCSLNYDGLCDRCCGVLVDMVETNTGTEAGLAVAKQIYPHILACKEMQRNLYNVA